MQIPRLNPERTNRQTQIKLLELDLKAAELEVESTKSDLESVEQNHKKGVMPASAVAKARLDVRRAEIQVEKLRVMLSAEQEQAGPAPRRTSTKSVPSDAAPRPAPAPDKPT
jgi:hypothetical protein